MLLGRVWRRQGEEEAQGEVACALTSAQLAMTEEAGHEENWRRGGSRRRELNKKEEDGGGHVECLGHGVSAYHVSIPQASSNDADNL